MSGTRALILGCGYVGMRLLRTLVAEGVTVAATSREVERLRDIEEAGGQPLRADVLEPASLRPLVEWKPQVVFDLVKPQRLDIARYTTWGTQNVASAFTDSKLDALVYLSSTAVYGPTTGEWTDEDTPVNPTSPAGEARAEAERIYLNQYRGHGLPVRICRSPGIYGPERTLRQRLETGAYRRMDDEGLSVSRIHVDDLVAGLIAAWRNGTSGQVYLLCDDEPVSGEEYADLVANLLSLPLPPTIPREDIREELLTVTFERRAESRRCSNRRMREELRVVPRYPTVREGVPAALAEEGAI